VSGEGYGYYGIAFIYMKNHIQAIGQGEFFIFNLEGRFCFSSFYGLLGKNGRKEYDQQCSKEYVFGHILIGFEVF
jgi:hypothetical protein